MCQDSRILISCCGTSDPVRGLRDGPLLHIMRHYRPSVVCLVMTPEMSELEQTDGRFQKMLQFVEAHWDGYRPTYLPFHIQITDASDLDELERPLEDAVQTTQDNYPDAKLLVNLTSGTPQMQIILAQIALDPRYNAIGIQVKNPEKKAGTSQRTNDKDYDIETELELNEDEDPTAGIRCREPKLFYIQKSKQKEQIRVLLEQRDYTAISCMKGSLPAPLMTLVRHLNARSHLQNEEARRLARLFKLPFPLYPIKKVSDLPHSDYSEAVEYFLVMKNMQHARRYTDFVLRLNPFVLRLQCAALNRYLPYPLRDILDSRGGRRQILSVSKLEQKDPALRTHLDTRLRKGGRSPVEDRDLSIFLCNYMLEALNDVPQAVKDVCFACGKLSSTRNQAAHELTSITDTEIRAECGLTSAQIVQKVEQIFPFLYPECHKDIFDVYQKCNDYILDHI